MSSATRSDWSRYLRWIEKAWGPLSVRALEPKHVLKLRDTYAQVPAAANNLLRCLSAMMGWSSRVVGATLTPACMSKSSKAVTAMRRGIRRTSIISKRMHEAIFGRRRRLPPIPVSAWPTFLKCVGTTSMKA